MQRFFIGLAVCLGVSVMYAHGAGELQRWLRVLVVLVSAGGAWLLDSDDVRRHFKNAGFALGFIRTGLLVVLAMLAGQR